MQKVEGVLTIAQNRIMSHIVNPEIEYHEWLKHVEVLKMLEAYNVEGIDYLTMGIALLNAHVNVSKEWEEEYYKELSDLQEFVTELDTLILDNYENKALVK